MQPLIWTHLSSGPFSARRKHCCLIQDRELILLGGLNSENLALNDVWSFDLIKKEWKIAAASANWSARDGHCCLLFKGFLKDFPLQAP